LLDGPEQVDAEVLQVDAIKVALLHEPGTDAAGNGHLFQVGFLKLVWGQDDFPLFLGMGRERVPGGGKHPASQKGEKACGADQG
jgi:hypothetical protein